MSDPEKFIILSNRRLTSGRKAAIIDCVRSGELLLPDVLQYHNITTEEWLQWCADYDKAGTGGLARHTRWPSAEDRQR